MMAVCLIFKITLRLRLLFVSWMIIDKYVMHASEEYRVCMYEKNYRWTERDETTIKI